MKKIYLTLILALSTLTYAQNDQMSFGYIRRFDRGYLGNNYAGRPEVLEGTIVQNTGGVPY